MQRVIYWLIFPPLWFISILPWKVFYLLSDFVFLIIYYVIGYRKKVVTRNLKNAFPKKSKKELKTIRKKFYQHMCDMFLEMVKSITIPNDSIKKRYAIQPEVFQKLEKSPKSYMIIAAHYANYEWSNVIDFISDKTCVGVYKKIKNPYFEKLIKKIRGRFGSEVILNTDVIKHALLKERKPETRGKRIYGLIIDQTPKSSSKNHLVNFLGREVPAFTGAEALAKKLDLPVVYCKVTKVKRGFYEAEYVEIPHETNETSPFPITEKFYELLEEQIKERPELYLWTHKRWKHAKK